MKRRAASAAAAAAICALAVAASAHGSTVRRTPTHAPWTLHASISATERYAEIDLRSDGTYVEHGGPNGSEDVDCTGRGRLTTAMLHGVTDAVHQIPPLDWRAAYRVYAERAAAQAVADDSPVTLPAATSSPSVEQAYLRLSVARREYRTMVEFADGAYRNDAPADLVRVVNALQRPLTLCRPLNGSARG